MDTVQLGESCIIFKELSTNPHEIAQLLNQNLPTGLHEAVPAFNQIALYFEPETFNPEAVHQLIAEFSSPNKLQKSSKTHIIPAVYSSQDTEEVATILNLTTSELIRIHSSAHFTVEAIGFCPGFPYLAGLPEYLQGIPRRATPRTHVEPGSIGITGDQCCIYPLVRPGGWNLIAQTPLNLVEPDDNYFPLEVGDQVQFQPITTEEFQKLKKQRL